MTRETRISTIKKVVVVTLLATGTTVILCAAFVGVVLLGCFFGSAVSLALEYFF